MINLTTVYEIHFSSIMFSFFQSVIPTIIGLLLILLLFKKIKDYYNSKENTKFKENIDKQVSNPKIIFNILKVVIVLLFSSLSLFYSVQNNDKITFYNEYKNGNYSVVEGCTSNYKPSKDRVESFNVNDVEFSYLPGHTFGYDISGEDGGAINGNDIYVKIYYVTDIFGTNYIMKLEVE